MSDTIDLIEWIIGSGLSGKALEEIVGTLSKRLIKLGFPLVRVSIAMPSIDPLQRGFSVSWSKYSPVATEVQGHDDAGEDMFVRSPIYYLLSNDLLHGRWRLAEDDTSSFPLLRELSDLGATDYVIKLVAFPGGTALAGVGFSIAVDGSEGFNDQQVAIIEKIMPALALVCFQIAAMRVATDMLAVYTGARTSGRILSGQTRRGDGTAIYAAILLADLKNFTSLNERWPAERIVAWLNEHFEAVAQSVEQNGGEILKFMGDSLLAIFPADVEDPADACRRALSAATGAMDATVTLNQARYHSDQPEIPIDIVLHVGEVFYGNVGAARRLDFTVVGRAVNEAARIEKLADDVGHSLLASADFVAQCPDCFHKVGNFALKGVAEPASVFAWGPPTFERE
ncbi:adenylate/guanylate cyclase domain-containing protein [Rhizobium grahamii]|uniref:Adenylate cyclase n=2 Tax=Rhizobium grahamii TaxID=1120045 RepID=S3H6V5_9HYPH|nr:adenylate/guanylate cyclase domain-containing protein [Rhizobium grahamii]EPE94617.1 adenylate cyclase [Rhizobium grahamii CCGE 502]RDJ06131.1 adenylate/guanylate cyclase domain-containing protein [Rhizobium grahamii]